MKFLSRLGTSLRNAAAHEVLRSPHDRREGQLPLPVRNERGEGAGEGHLIADAQASHNKNDPPLPSPLLLRREEREKPSALSSVGQVAVPSVWRHLRSVLAQRFQVVAR